MLNHLQEIFRRIFLRDQFLILVEQKYHKRNGIARPESVQIDVILFQHTDTRLDFPLAVIQPAAYRIFGNAEFAGNFIDRFPSVLVKNRTQTLVVGKFPHQIEQQCRRDPLLHLNFRNFCRIFVVKILRFGMIDRQPGEE